MVSWSVVAAGICLVHTATQLYTMRLLLGDSGSQTLSYTLLIVTIALRLRSNSVQRVPYGANPAWGQDKILAHSTVHTTSESS
jgi:hypothetical protein